MAVWIQPIPAHAPGGDAKNMTGLMGRTDCARFIKGMLEEHYPDAIKVRLVIPRKACLAVPAELGIQETSAQKNLRLCLSRYMINLNTHSVTSL